MVIEASGEHVTVDTSRARWTGPVPPSGARSAPGFRRSNQNTCLNQRIIATEGDLVAKGDVLADGPSTEAGAGPRQEPPRRLHAVGGLQLRGRDHPVRRLVRDNFDLVLPPLLFEAAINIHWTALRRDAVPVLTLAIAGTLISAVVVGAGMVLVMGWPLQSAVLFGVLIAATDPVAVIAMFKDNGVSGRLRLLVESESLFNDGVAAVLFTLAFTWAQATGGDMVTPAEVAKSLLFSVGGGTLAGLACARLAIAVAGRTSDHLVESALTTVTAYGSFMFAEHFLYSGVLATVAAGLLMGNVGILAEGDRGTISQRGRKFALALWDFIAFIINSLIFLLIGVNVASIPFSRLGASALAIVIGAGPARPGADRVSAVPLLRPLPMGGRPGRPARPLVGRAARRAGSGAGFVVAGFDRISERYPGGDVQRRRVFSGGSGTDHADPAAEVRAAPTQPPRLPAARDRCGDPCAVVRIAVFDRRRSDRRFGHRSRLTVAPRRSRRSRRSAGRARPAATGPFSTAARLASNSSTVAMPTRIVPIA